jgi:hypothetical protein
MNPRACGLATQWSWSSWLGHSVRRRLALCGPEAVGWPLGRAATMPAVRALALSQHVVRVLGGRSGVAGGAPARQHFGLKVALKGESGGGRRFSPWTAVVQLQRPAARSDRSPFRSCMTRVTSRMHCNTKRRMRRC